jgi:hypothetical protein
MEFPKPVLGCCAFGGRLTESRMREGFDGRRRWIDWAISGECEEILIGDNTPSLLRRFGWYPAAFFFRNWNIFYNL